MSKKTIVTIGRQFGSEGREIGRRLAELSGAAFYDKELLWLAARDSGITPELFESNDELPVNSLLYSLSTQPPTAAIGHTISMDPLPLPHKLFLAQFDAVRKVAAQGDCVIVGRCADYALRDNPDCVNVFIHAPLEIRIQRVCARQGLDSNKAKDLIVKTDKKRAAYYNSFSDRRWGAIDTYHLTVDSSLLGAEKTAELLYSFLQNRV